MGQAQRNEKGKNPKADLNTSKSRKLTGEGETQYQQELDQDCEVLDQEPA